MVSHADAKAARTIKRKRVGRSLETAETSSIREKEKERQTASLRRKETFRKISATGKPREKNEKKVYSCKRGY